ncbi:MAG: insulinase family protein [Fibrobacter sp.]|nr:insulinase family protein [Fibrobacter sp.]
MMQNKYRYLAFVVCAAASLAAVVACSSAPAPEAEPAQAISVSKAPVTSAKAEASPVPATYKDIKYPAFNYVAPSPKDYRVDVAEGITGFIVSDHSLPLVNLTVFFEESKVPAKLEDEAASEMVGSMLRRGAGGGISAHDLDDSLEFVSASISTSAGSFYSAFDIDCLSKDFPALLELSRKVLTEPAFDKDQLEILKANFVTAYERRYETPAKVLSALKAKVNYAPNPRLWDATAEEYKKVTVEDVKRLAQGAFSSKHIVFALSGDVDRDSAVTQMKEFFANWKVAPADSNKPTPKTISFVRKPGIYVVDKDITQANITMNQPFVMRPHPDYYPTAVASFILGGGSFTSRLMNRVRSEEGLAYSIYSLAGNDYRDTAMTTIALQTKVESVGFAMKLIFEEIDKLAKDGPTADELEQAKKAIVESLPAMFDSPESIASIFAKDALLGKTDDHYVKFVSEVNAVTAEQVKAMVAKYFDKNKMTISIVAPVAKLDSIKPFTVVPLDSLEFR